MPTCIYPVISFDSVYDESNLLGRLLAPRNDQEPSTVMDVETARKFSSLHSKEDNMFICLSKYQVGAETGDIIYACDPVYSEENTSFVRSFHVVTTEDIQMVNVFRDSGLNDSVIMYYIYKKSTGKVHKLEVSQKSWRLDGWGSTPVSPLSASVKGVCATKSYPVPVVDQSKVQVSVKRVNNRPARAFNTGNSSITTSQVDQQNQELMNVNVDPTKFQYDRHVEVYLDYREDNGTKTQYIANVQTLYAFVSSGTSIECRGVANVTVSGSGPVHIRIFSNTQFSEDYFFGVGVTDNNYDKIINIYQDALYNPYDSGDSFIIERASLELDFSNFGAGDWIWWSDPKATKAGNASGYVSDYFGDATTGNWRIIKTQDNIIYKIGGSVYGTAFATMDALNTMFNVQFDTTPQNKRLEYEDSSSFTYSIGPISTPISLTKNQYTWLPYNSLENSQLTVAEESFVRTQYNFEQVSSGSATSFAITPGNAFKIYPTTTDYNSTGLTIQQNTQTFGSSYGVTIFTGIDAQTWDTNQTIPLTQQLHGLTSSGVLAFNVGSGIVTEVFSNSATSSSVIDIKSKRTPTGSENITFTKTGGRYLASSGDYFVPNPGYISFAYNTSATYNVYPLEMFITSTPVVTYVSSGTLGSQTTGSYGQFRPMTVSFKVRTRAFVLSNTEYLTATDGSTPATDDMTNLIHTALLSMTGVSSANITIQNASQPGVNYGDIVTFDEEEEVVIDISGTVTAREVFNPAYALTNDAGNFYFKEQGTELSLMATNLDLSQVLPGSQEVPIFKLDSTNGGVVAGLNVLNELNTFYNGLNWVFGTNGTTLSFLYKDGENVRQIAVFDAAAGTVDNSHIGLNVKYTTLEANKWRIKGVTNGLTFSSTQTFVVFEYYTGSQWVAAARLGAIV